MLVFMILDTLLSGAIYGAIIYVNWETLGIFVDKCTKFDIIFPLLLSTGATTCGVLAICILDGDWI